MLHQNPSRSWRWVGKYTRARDFDHKIIIIELDGVGLVLQRFMRLQSIHLLMRLLPTCFVRLSVGCVTHRNVLQTWESPYAFLNRGSLPQGPDFPCFSQPAFQVQALFQEPHDLNYWRAGSVKNGEFAYLVDFPSTCSPDVDVSEFLGPWFASSEFSFSSTGKLIVIIHVWRKDLE